MYALVMVSIILDVFLPVLPSGSLLIVAVVYAAHGDGGFGQIVLLGLGGALASTLGDNIAYRIVRRGTGFADRWLERLPRVRNANERMRGAMRTRTRLTMSFARLIPTGRTVAVVVAATDPQLPHRRFRRASANAAIVWATYTVGLGYLNALLFDTAWVSVVVGLTAAFAVGTVLARSRRAVALSS